jgi:hypothetical protein
MLEKQVYPDLREYPGGPPQRLYDVVAHTLPIQMEVNVVTVSRPFEATLTKTGPLTAPSGTVEGGAPRAYVLGHDSNASIKALNEMFKAPRQAADDRPRHRRQLRGGRRPHLRSDPPTTVRRSGRPSRTERRRPPTLLCSIRRYRSHHRDASSRASSDSDPEASCHRRSRGTIDTMNATHTSQTLFRIAPSKTL